MPWYLDNGYIYWWFYYKSVKTVKKEFIKGWTVWEVFACAELWDPQTDNAAGFTDSRALVGVWPWRFTWLMCFQSRGMWDNSCRLDKVRMCGCGEEWDKQARRCPVAGGEEQAGPLGVGRPGADKLTRIVQMGPVSTTPQISQTNQKAQFSKLAVFCQRNFFSVDAN